MSTHLDEMNEKRQVASAAHDSASLSGQLQDQGDPGADRTS
jgi:hypothetical protein